jgi:hypothetical protein
MRVHSYGKIAPASAASPRLTEHMEKRYEQASASQEHPSTHWTKKAHCYIDTKEFVLAPARQQKRLLRSTQVHHLLGTPAGGQEELPASPKSARMLLGIPSFDVTAAVGPDGTFSWHSSTGRWNGESAAKMYRELAAALPATTRPTRPIRHSPAQPTRGREPGPAAGG